MKFKRLATAFAAIGVFGAGALSAQQQTKLLGPDSTDVFRDDVGAYLDVYACSKDNFVVGGLFLVQPSISDMQRTGTVPSPEAVQQTLSETWAKAAAELTAFDFADPQNSAALNNALIKYLPQFQDAAERQSNGVSFKIRISDAAASPTPGCSAPAPKP